MIGLVACAATKLDRPAPARELYVSRLFVGSLEYALARCSCVYVLSALHGLLELGQVIEPYDRRLGDKAERERWARGVAAELLRRHGSQANYMVLAGAGYAGPLTAELVPDRVVQPLRGMMIGERLRFLRDAAGGAS